MIRIGTRGSNLALWQAKYVQKLLIDISNSADVSLNIIKTSGDKIHDKKLSSIGGKGLFVKEIEEALINHEIDIAVHSMKDVPSELPSGLRIGAVIKREDPRDVLVSRVGVKFYDLSAGSIIGTGSLRRQVQLLSLRNDIKIRDIRGNVDTRLSKLYSGEFDGVVLACAGIKRLGQESKITQIFSTDDVIPSAGQGIIGIECRENDTMIGNTLNKINDKEAQISITAERNFVKMLGGDCNLPIACHCEFTGEKMIKITGFIGSIDAKNIIRHSVSGKPEDGLQLSKELANIVLNNGGQKIVESYKTNK